MFEVFNFTNLVKNPYSLRVGNAGMTGDGVPAIQVTTNSDESWDNLMSLKDLLKNLVSGKLVPEFPEKFSIIFTALQPKIAANIPLTNAELAPLVGLKFNFNGNGRMVFN